jgi:hypothetical protein
MVTGARVPEEGGAVTQTPGPETLSRKDRILAGSGQEKHERAP